MPKYNVQFQWTSYGAMEVEASSAEAAMEWVKENADVEELKNDPDTQTDDFEITNVSE